MSHRVDHNPIRYSITRHQRRLAALLPLKWKEEAARPDSGVASLRYFDEGLRRRRCRVGSIGHARRLFQEYNDNARTHE